MEAGLLFYLSRRTSVCQKILEKNLQWFGVGISGVKFCAAQSHLNAGMASLLRQYPAVFLTSPLEEGRPVSSEPIFQTLKIPTDSAGEPLGVRRLPGRQAYGYMVESSRQAIFLLPDEPCELLKMLSPACDGLKRKFGLKGDLPPSRKVNFETLLAGCVETLEG